jgi:hypothetical protein
MRTFFLRDEAGFPVACVATEKSGVSSVAYAVSAWNDKLDQFDRRIGSRVAKGR